MEVKRSTQVSSKTDNAIDGVESFQELLRLTYILRNYAALSAPPDKLTRKVCLLVPCYNEERGIGVVIDNLPMDLLRESNYNIEVVVIDNNSSDKTTEVAASRGATVLHETKQGKGCAVKKGFQYVPDNVDYVVMIDGDGSYDIREIMRLLEPLEHNFADVVVGTRLHGKLDNDSMRALNRMGNWIFTFLARIVYHTNVTDVCSGFYAWKKDVIKVLSENLESNGFSIEMEMIAKMGRLNFESCSVPISYHAREGKSSLRPLHDGFLILKAWLKYLRWKPKNMNYIITPPTLSPHIHS
jgi:dolichol-phosphate mannosyltransferase